MSKKTLTITIADTKAEFDIDLDNDRELEVSMEYGRRTATTSLMGFLRALGLVVVVEERPMISADDLLLK
jgi:hypothetical protein